MNAERPVELGREDPVAENAVRARFRAVEIDQARGSLMALAADVGGPVPDF